MSFLNLYIKGVYMLTANNGLYMYQQFVPLWIYKTFFS